MCPADTARSHPRTLRGFNLIEAAIVLGVVGLVIGGIWVAASSVTAKNNVNNFVRDVNSIIHGIKNVGNANVWAGVAVGGTSVSIGLNSALISMGITPSNWQMNTTTGYLQDPYYNSVFYVTISNAALNLDRFEIHIEADADGLEYFSTSECMNITSALYVSLKNTLPVRASSPYSNIMRVMNSSGSTNQRTLTATSPSFVTLNPCLGLSDPWSIILYVPF